MQVRTRQEGGAPGLPATSASSVAVAGSRIGSRAIVVAVACAALAIATLTVSMKGSSEVRTADHERPAAASSNDGAVPTAKLDRTIGWIDGLATGLILPSDVTSRLSAQDPELAKTVMSVWSELDPISGVRLDKTIGWIDGLASGLILQSDVASRLANQDPELGEAVMATWSELDGSGADVDTAVSWVDGLASGLILPSDVTSRLATQDPETAEAIMAAWSHLSVDLAGEARP